MKRMRAFSIFLLVLFFASCSTGQSHKVVIHPQKTGIATHRYFDQGRERPLITEVWYPVDETVPAKPVSGLWVRCPEARDAPLRPSSSKYPLIVMSHGNGGDRFNVSWLAEILAANGYIVAAMDHHGNTWNNKIAECFIKIWERPRDVSFVIDEILKDPHFGPYIDSRRIGVAGYSLGGHTGVWLAGGQISEFDKPTIDEIPEGQLPTFVTPEIISQIDFSPAKESYRDPRVSAAFLMAPALINLFDFNSLAAIQIPVYVVAPESDQLVPFEKNGKHLAYSVQKAVFHLIPGAANHYVFLNEVSKGGKMMLDKSVAHDPPMVDRRQIHEDIGLSAVKFFHQHLR